MMFGLPALKERVPGLSNQLAFRRGRGEEE